MVRQHRPRHQHDDELGQALELAIESLDGVHQVDPGVVGVGGDCLLAFGTQCHRDLGDSGLRAPPRVLLDPLQRESSGKHREKARRQRQLRDAVGNGDQPERQELVEPDRLLMAGAQMEDELPDQGTQDCTDRQPTADRPQHVDGQPAPATAEIAQAEQSECEQHEWKRSPVVEATLSGQAEAKTVSIRRALDLHVRGEDGIGGRQYRGEQDRSPYRQTEQ